MAPLSTPPGFAITIAQLRNNKPTAVIECQVCPQRRSFDIPLDDICAAGRAINTAIGDWLTHPCSGDVRSDMQDVPAPHVHKLREVFAGQGAPPRWQCTVCTHLFSVPPPWTPDTAVLADGPLPW